MRVRDLLRDFVYFVPVRLLWLLNVRFPSVYISRIGHLLMELDCAVKERLLGLHPAYRFVVLADRRDVANRPVLRYWRRYVHIVTFPQLVKLLRPFQRHPLTGLNIDRYVGAIHQSSDFAHIQAQWGDRPPLLRIDERDARRGMAALRSLGIQPGQWYVCVHSREPGYSPGDDDAHSYRNSSFDDYLLAVEYIVSRGGVCVRMGDASAAPVPEIPGLVDYARHPLRSDWLDVYLSANCSFFLGNTSGAFAMASVFGVPVACANMAPLSVVYPNGPRDVGIPKLYKERATGRLLTFPEILAQPMANWRFAGDFETAGIELINNTPEEIRDLAREQLERITSPGIRDSVADEELQQRFRDLFRPGHYMYGSASRVGQAFLRHHAALLTSANTTEASAGGA